MKLALSLIVLSSTVFAAGNGGHGSVADLTFPAINFVLVFGFLAFKLKNPVKDAFNKNADSVKDLFESAETRSKEAKIKFEEYESKLNNLKSTQTATQADSDDIVNKFINKLKRDTDNQIDRMKSDADKRLEAEEQSMVNSISSELIESVIAKAKTDISSDNGKKDSAKNSILSQLK